MEAYEKRVVFRKLEDYVIAVVTEQEIEKILVFCKHISMDCVYISEGSHLWNHNDVVIYLRGICHEENSIVFKIFNFTVIFNSMDYYNVFH